jgi:hypothetical protein
MNKFRVGDRVAVYGVTNELRPAVGTVYKEKYTAPGFVDVRWDSILFAKGVGSPTSIVHPKQCRLLKKKKQPKHYWGVIERDSGSLREAYNSKHFANNYVARCLSENLQVVKLKVVR